MGESNPRPLMSLCTEKIFSVADIEELDHILGKCFPPGMFPDLLRAVLFNHRIPAKLPPGKTKVDYDCLLDKLMFSPISVRLLLKHWPDKTLKIKELGLDDLAISLKCDQDIMGAILKGFLDSLGHVWGSQLRIIDLRGVELREMDFLKNYRTLFLDPFLPQTNCMIYLDLNITYANDYILWSEILSKVQGIVKISRLSTIFRTGFDSTKIILDALDDTMLTSLAAKHLEMVNEEFVLLVDSLSRFSNLAELDLSCGMLRLAVPRSSEENNDSAVEGLSKILLSLPKLKKLNLSNNKLGGNVKTFFQPVSFSLSSLEMKNCGLMCCDLVFMNSDEGRMLQNLTDLNLADNFLTNFAVVLIEFLGKLSKLQNLSLEECCLKESQAKQIAELAHSKLRHLSSVNFSGHKWGKATLLDCIDALVPTNGLTSLILPSYGIGSLQFKFKVNRFQADRIKRASLSQVLEPIPGECTELDEIRQAVEKYRGKFYKTMTFKINWLDGLAFHFQK